MAKDGKGAQAPRMRLSAEQRDRFLEVLGQTGNRDHAAGAIGVEPRLMDQRRRFDKLLDAGWEAALDQAHRRLSGAHGPFDCIGGRELNVIRRGPKGRLRLIKAGPRRWSKAVEERFLAMLAVSGNVAGSARAVGFTESCIWQRRRKWADFARRMEEVLDDAEVKLEFRMATMGNDTDQRALGEGETPGGVIGDAGAEAAIPFDPDLALRFLKWRQQKKAGYGHRGRRRNGPPERSFDEAVQSVLGKVEAIDRHDRREKLAEGWCEDENGYLIPPGWVRAEGGAPPPAREDGAEEDLAR